MGAKAEISWKRVNDEGEKMLLYAQHVGTQWKFFIRDRRFEQWQPLADPPLEDWLELLDAVRRRIGRRLQRPEEEQRLKRTINEKFPAHKIED
ncbi:MAG TPA: hypothetical protein VH413_13990 [Verrucomicrobiae bacterium]|jgi:hypothetical protein|nr:hypothetical protein [Verrucomicrobiae bacterium]